MSDQVKKIPSRSSAPLPFLNREEKLCSDVPKKIQEISKKEDVGELFQVIRENSKYCSPTKSEEVYLDSLMSVSRKANIYKKSLIEDEKNIKEYKKEIQKLVSQISNMKQRCKKDIESKQKEIKDLRIINLKLGKDQLLGAFKSKPKEVNKMKDELAAENNKLKMEIEELNQRVKILDNESKICKQKLKPIPKPPTPGVDKPETNPFRMNPQ